MSWKHKDAQDINDVSGRSAPEREVMLEPGLLMAVNTIHSL
jgi:hypothetical protein